jgi:creatinine amidohydrolase
VREYIFGLAAMGLERFLFINGHGGNIASLDAATWEIYAQAAESTLPHAGRIRVAVAQWWATKGVLAVSRELFGENEGGHATPSEISVAMYAHPECDWRAERVPAGMVPAAMPRALGAGTVDFQRAWPDGRIESDPTRARPEHGRRLVAAAVADLAETWRQVLG